MTYEQRREMSQHERLSEMTGVKIYFTESHSPSQRGINENTNAMRRQYMTKGTDLTMFAQLALDAMAWEINTRPRNTLDWRCPAELFMPESFYT